MRNYKIVMRTAPILLGMALTACGGNLKNSESAMSAVGFIHSYKNDDVNAEYMNENMIEVQKDMTILARKNLNDSSGPLYLKEGDSLTVIKKEKDKSGQEFVQIYLEDESQSDNVQEVLWIPVEALNSQDLAMMDIEDPFDENGEEIVEVDELELSPLMTSAKKAKAKKRKKKMTYCYRFVKIRLQKLGLVKVYLPGGSAHQAAGVLPKHGFQRTSRGVAKARVNDVCVYTGGNGGNGHIEIRMAGGWWYGYGVKKNSIGNKNHRLVACFSKG